MGTRLRRAIAASLFIVCSFTLSSAQEMVFPLDPGRVGEPYRQSIEDILAEDYGTPLNSATHGAAYVWVQLENLPPGLKLKSDGTITGIPLTSQGRPYRFKVKFTDLSTPQARTWEVSFAIPIMPRRSQLAGNNAPAPAQTFIAPEQTSLPAGSTSVASGEGVANGNNSTAPAQFAANVRAERATRLASLVDASAGNQFQASNTDNVNTQGEANTGSGTAARAVPTSGSQTYFKLYEQSKGKAELLDLSTTPPTTEFFADRKSTIRIERNAAASATATINITAELGNTAPKIIGGRPTSGQANAQSSVPPNQTNVVLSQNDNTAEIRLKDVAVRKGDVLNVTLQVMDGNIDKGTHRFTVTLDDYGVDKNFSPSIFLLNRPGIENSDIASNLQIIPTNGQTVPVPTTPLVTIPTTDITNSVNYSPSPGLNYTFSFKPKPNKVGFRYKVLSLLEPGFGVNATFMDFNDQTLNFTDLQQKFLTNQGSDVQLGVGGALSFVGNNIQLTYGANLNAKRRRGYFAFGINFAKLLDFIRP